MNKEVKKKLVVSYKNCSEEVLEAIRLKYPNGYHDFVFKVTKPNNDYFYAITVDTTTSSYLVKVDVKIDDLTDEEFDKEFGSNDIPDENSFGGDAEGIENLESSEEGFEE